jgi:hypothetical protein
MREAEGTEAAAVVLPVAAEAVAQTVLAFDVFYEEHRDDVGRYMPDG